ncbi:MAG: bifunctional 3,4-dihydroxy-2-butanone-4-phosphate synthase/GTP cyclohydrolase II [Planctomycetes bacterium]|nr:bifunctional 3,4-dihydroxy-2-butanone-4-phosphate synthase/GTP cyclohydrolase II [Planctomycetota bacterium]
MNTLYDKSVTPFAPVEEVLEELRQGKMVVLVDDDNRENEGDLVIAAEKVTAESINFMATEGRGWICLALAGELCDRLDLPMMVSDEKNEAPFGTAFTVTIEARDGVSTGISAADRAHTIKTAVREGSRASDLVRPGHVQPIRARQGGVLVRAGQTEGSVDLMRLAGLQPAGVICEIMKPDGTMARLPELQSFCAENNLLLCSVAQIIAHRRRNEKLVECVQTVKLPTDVGDFDLHCYVSNIDDGEHHIALTVGDLRPGREPIDHPVLLRVHSECLTGDVFHSCRCDCGEQIHAAMKMVQEVGEGAIIYMRQEGRGIGLPNKIKAYGLQDNGMDTVEANEELGFPADLRDYGIGAQIIANLGIRKMNLITNNPRKVAGLCGYGLEVVERVPIVMTPKETNRNYLATKRTKLGHILD